MRIFKNRNFARFAQAEGMDDAALCRSVEEAGRGLIAADLGGGVIKQRIARRGAGKSGGFRVIVLFRVGDRAFFVYGFGKNERSNIAADELRAFRRLATEMLAYDDDQLAAAVAGGALIEVVCNEEAVQEQDNGGDP